jgi:hypothetical protein
MYKCKHFGIKELVSPNIYNMHGDKAWGVIDERILRTIDALRERFGSCTVNDWSWGGKFEHSGFRDESYYKSTDAYLKSRSQHKYGRAMDCKFKNHKAHEVRKYIIQNQDEFPYVTFIETGPLKNGVDMSWVHIDVRNSPLVCWSPAEGVLNATEVINRKL